MVAAGFNPPNVIATNPVRRVATIELGHENSALSLNSWDQTIP